MGGLAPYPREDRGGNRPRVYRKAFPSQALLKPPRSRTGGRACVRARAVREGGPIVPRLAAPLSGVLLPRRSLISARGRFVRSCERSGVPDATQAQPGRERERNTHAPAIRGTSHARFRSILVIVVQV
jgi:hypothetical protein